MNSHPAAQQDTTWTPRPLDPALTDYHPQPLRPPADASYLTGGGAARISGSGHCRFILERLSAAFRRLHPEVDFSIELHGTPSAMAFLINGKAMLSVMGREITANETVPYRKLRGAEPFAIRVASAAQETRQHLATSLAVYVHRDNPLPKIDCQQLARIFTQGNPGGDYSRWGQLGLTGDWAMRAIQPLTTHEFSGFGTYMQKHHYAGRVHQANCEYFTGTDALLTRLENEPAGIAVAAIGRANASLRLVPLAFNDQGPWLAGSAQEVTDGVYPLGRFIYFYLPVSADSRLDAVTHAFMRFILSRQGQAIVASQPCGYIPLSAVQAAQQLARLQTLEIA
ncbi:phosphate-binding protein [Affinibrenneria salicis]|uniref:Phosphate-binding protein n=1 Tax=Affinibrenneria salicis TaxID=2590031 RepID=A0A5J5G1Z7_9GAMM|nr:substrate-binding domain-containing protein [Affinibrenneria salicis]KAA9000512.1 phosphate-binding protein [Affinibrenneria salicis]